MDNVKGRTIAFGTFSPFKSWWHCFVEGLALFMAPINDRAARRPEFLHTALFSRVTPKHLKRAGLESDTLKSGALLFFSHYNGDGETYFRGFSEKLAAVLDAVWSHCVEWEPAEDYANLDAFINKFRRPVATFFSTYPDESKRLQASLVLRRQIDKLVVLARSEASDEAFQQAFARTAQLHWGNQPATAEDQ